MSFILRPSTTRAALCVTQVIKRSAHKKANIQVRLSQPVDGLGLRAGLMRNFLFPAKKATYISKDYNPEQEEEVIDSAQLEQEREEALKKKEMATKKDEELLHNLKGVYEIKFSRAVIPGSENTFGSVTVEDIVHKLKAEYDITVDKSNIHVKTEGGRIKALGSHLVTLHVGQQITEITVKVEPTA
ncbi:hypothetical protein BCV71DRAFT_240453 [Rhizopus microsporus]|uniref:50S ribosomal protein L9, chloroplastic n=1 Tax=Rhizopus microsporus TaxID=58291 RepID=A0A1X0SH32_RHIZD|nr:hypothetical protein BCV71DRAFT_240453 [Rhizopus microsporus]